MNKVHQHNRNYDGFKMPRHLVAIQHISSHTGIALNVLKNITYNPHSTPRATVPLPKQNKTKQKKTLLETDKASGLHGIFTASVKGVVLLTFCCFTIFSWPVRPWGKTSCDNHNRCVLATEETQEHAVTCLNQAQHLKVKLSFDLKMQESLSLHVVAHQSTYKTYRNKAVSSSSLK